MCHHWDIFSFRRPTILLNLQRICAIKLDISEEARTKLKSIGVLYFTFQNASRIIVSYDAHAFDIKLQCEQDWLLTHHSFRLHAGGVSLKEERKKLRSRSLSLLITDNAHVTSTKYSKHYKCVVIVTLSRRYRMHTESTISAVDPIQCISVTNMSEGNSSLVHRQLCTRCVIFIT